MLILSPKYSDSKKPSLVNISDQISPHIYETFGVHQSYAL